MSGQSASKTFFLVLILIPLVILMILFQMLFAVNGTVLSSSYFGRQSDRYLTEETVGGLVDDLLDNLDSSFAGGNGDEGELSPEAKDMLDAYKTMIQDNLDPAWAASEISNLLNGFLAYMTGRQDTLPTLDIAPAKAIFLELITFQIKANAGDNPEQVMANLFDEVAAASGGLMVDGKVNPKAVDEMLSADAFEAGQLSRNAAEHILMKAANAEAEGITDSDLLDYTLTEIINDMTGFSDMKDALDFNEFLTVLYRGGDHPLEMIRTMALGIRSTVMQGLAAMILILILIVGVVTFRPHAFLVWFGAGLVTAGLLVGIGALLSTVFFASAATANLEQVMTDALPADLTFIQDFVLSYVGGIGRFILIQSLVILAIGIASLVGSHFVHRFEKSRGLADPQPGAPKHRHPVLMAARVLVVLALLAALPLTAYFAVTSIERDISRFEFEQSVGSTDPAIDLDEALDQVLGTRFFTSMAEQMSDSPK